MSDLLLVSNETSPMIRGFLKDVQDLSYDLPKSFPSIVKRIDKISPQSAISGAPYSQEVFFNVPRTMIWDGGFIQHNCTVATGMTSSNFSVSPIGKVICDTIEISANNKTLFTFRDSAVVARCSDLEMSKATIVDRLSVPLHSTTYLPFTETGTAAIATTSYTTFTWLPAQWFESIRLRPDLATSEQLTVRILYNTAANSYGDDATVGKPPITAISPFLWTYKHTMDKKNYDLLNAKNMGKPGGLNLMLTSNTFTEKATPQSGETTQMTYRMAANFPVFKTHFFLKKKTLASGALTTTGVDGDNLVSINSFDFQVGGQSVFNSSVPGVVCNADSAMFTGKVGYTSESALRVIPLTGVMTINWGLLGDDRYMNTGCVSFSNLNNPTLVINYPTITAANYELQVVHEYWQHLAKDGTGQYQVVLKQ